MGRSLVTNVMLLEVQKQEVYFFLHFYHIFKHIISFKHIFPLIIYVDPWMRFQVACHLKKRASGFLLTIWCKSYHLGCSLFGTQNIILCFSGEVVG